MLHKNLQRSGAEGSRFRLRETSPWLSSTQGLVEGRRQPGQLEPSELSGFSVPDQKIKLTGKKIGDYRKKNVRKRTELFLEYLFNEKETIAHDCGSTGLVCSCCNQIKSCSKPCQRHPGNEEPDGLHSLEEALLSACWGSGSQALALAIKVSRATILIVAATWKNSDQQLINDAIRFHSAFTHFYLFVSMLPQSRPQQQK